MLDGTYFGCEPFEGADEHGGLAMQFAWWSQPLQAALEAAGLAITALREPIPDPVKGDRLDRWAHLPLSLWFNARILA
ncbi:hypothetical protein MesoLjLc_44480 [Mesorhizobium sp. L-8-10]|uniref:hypothetical protein n=1 Tax=Mesorhizobium sp. L-8-10 TaxID=2744523 RepID=UPI00192754DA|nr:hypothetical protein [Mesorhizobium sp. L-8-10]BCH32518.1 hypothetical protein MesoLjLc_44480 [Mesorhizobium sp. L-8-10]